MKKLSAILSVCTLAPFTALGEAVEHSVKAVSVFTDRAVITRSGTTMLKAGKNEIEFPGIRANIDLRSIRAGTEIPAGVEILGVSWERHVSQTVDNVKIAELESEIETLKEQESYLVDKTNALTVKNRYIQNLQNSLSLTLYQNARRKDGKPTDEKGWEAIAERVKSHISESADANYECQKELSRLRTKISTLQKQLDELYGSGNARRSLTLVVTLKADKNMSAEIPVVYTTHDAYWKPHYDARLKASAGTLDFTYNGLVYQNTGENWEDVRLTLSTAQAKVSAFPPKVRSIALSGRAPINEQREIVETQEAAPEPARQRIRSANSLQNAATPAEKLSSVRTQGASVTFEIKGTQNILSGKQAHRVAITEKHFTQLVLRYEAAPRLRNGVYLRTTAQNDTEYPILAGKVSIYRDSGFIGESSLKYTPVGSQFAFFAGTVDGLSAAFEPLAPYSAKTSKFFSSVSSGTAEGDCFTLANLTDKPCKIRLRAQIKVSEIDDVKISVLDKAIEHIPATTPGYVLDAKTGLIYWDVEVPSDSEKKVFLTTETKRK